MDELKREEILNYIRNHWGDDKSSLAKEIEYQYIFGPLGYNEHYNIDDIYELVNQIEEINQVEGEEYFIE